MRTSDQLYHQVRWDPRFDPARFVLGVSRRGTTPGRIPLPAFVPGGDIPWHRVLFVEADGEVVWDRATGVDRIDATDAGRVRHARLLRAPFFTAGTAYVYEGGEWVPAGVTSAPVPVSVPAPASLRVLTWNTLWDRYDSDRVHTAARRPLLLAALEESAADVIALQEVERDLLAMLLNAPWVRTSYTLGTDPGGRDVDETGLLLLSRLPVREAGHHVLGPHKAVTALTLETAAGPLVVAATHLSSDHSTDGAARRRTELAAIATGLSGIDTQDLILLGDFNDGSGGSGGPAAALGLRDAWSEVYGSEDSTPTFDPVTNPLAAVASLSGRAGRLDRVLVRGSALVAGAALRGDVPGAGGLYISDHYGVAAEIGLGAAAAGVSSDVLDVASTARTAVEAAGVDADATARLLVRTFAEGAVHVVGSRRMGCACAGADLDLVAVLPGDATDMDEVRERVSAAMSSSVREVVGARVPGLRFAIGELGVDLAVVAAGSLAPAQAVDRRAELGEAAAVALSAVSDAAAVRDAAGDRHDAFAGLARDVKAWARARGLDSAPFGGLPGLAWAVLAARTTRDADGLVGDDLLRHFFATWAAWDWRVPVGLTGVAGADAAPAPAPVTVLTPTAPIRTCTDQVGPGHRDLLVQELYRAWELLETGSARSEIRTPPPLHRRHAAWAVATVSTRRPDTLGRFRGRVRALLTALEAAGVRDVHAWPRPYATTDDSVRYAIGLGTTPPDAVALALIVDPWGRGLRGVEVAWARGGDVPALR